MAKTNPRTWSNRELLRFAHLFEGSVVNVSGWTDKDKEGRLYSEYFTGANSYSLTNWSTETSGFQGCKDEILLDLTQPLVEEHKGRWDVVFNHTVLEHIFDFQTAFKNLCLMSRDIVIVVLPWFFRHHPADSYGDYWRFSAQAVKKLFKANGYEAIYCSCGPKDGEHYVFAIGSKNPQNWDMIAGVSDNGLTDDRMVLRDAGKWVRTSAPVKDTVVCMATFPPRDNVLKLALDSLINQVEKMYIYFNGYTDGTVPDYVKDNPKIEYLTSEVDGDNKAFSRFYWYKRGELKGKYVFFVDDDLVYPDNYVPYMMQKMQQHGEDKIICVHGGCFFQPITSYFRSRETFNYQRKLEEDTTSDLIGTGTALLRGDLLDLEFGDETLNKYDWTVRNDLFLSCIAAEKEVAMVAVERPAKWLKPHQGVKIAHGISRTYKADLLSSTSQHAEITKKLFGLLKKGKSKNRHVCTVADSGVSKELNDWVNSIRFQGWDDTIYVYSPEGDVPELPAGCESIERPAWWGGSGSKVKSKNITALLKPEIFLDTRWAAGDQVLYMDCADIVIFCPPWRIFEAAFDSDLAARVFMESKLTNFIPKDILGQGILDERYIGKGDIPNNGVIIGKVGQPLFEIMEEWRSLLELYPVSGAWFPGSTKCGDQYSFSYVWRKAAGAGVKLKYLNEKYNFNQGNRVRKLTFKKGLLFNGKNQIFVPHSSGHDPLSPEIIAASVGQKAAFTPRRQPERTNQTGQSSKHSPSQLRARRRRLKQRERREQKKIERTLK